MNIKINPDNELFKWGPLDAIPLFVYPFIHVFTRYPKEYGFTYGNLFGSFKDGKITIILDDRQLRKDGAKPFNEVAMDKKKLNEAFFEWDESTKKVHAFEELVNHSIHSWDDDKLLKMFEAWTEVHYDFWLKGCLPEISGFGGEEILKDDVLEKHPDDVSEIIESLSAPTRLSFFQKEEEERMSIKLVNEEATRELMLQSHARKYYWIKNSYSHSDVLSTGYFQQMLEGTSDADAKKRLDEIGRYEEDVMKRKEEVIRKHDVGKKTVDISEALSFCVWWQDLRKKYIFIANHINSVFAREISIREDIPYEDLEQYMDPEIISLLKSDEKLDVSERKKAFLMYYEDGAEKLQYLSGEEAEKAVEPYLRIDVDESVSEVSGTIVSKGVGGVIEGRVRIVGSPKDASDFLEGDILVSPFTSPDYVPLMRKASAIITDEGGVSSHAAIVSRELGKPCIVATKIATKIFKDRDMVEMDMKAGYIRRVQDEG